MNKFIFLVVSLTIVSCNSRLESLIFKQFQKFIKKYKKNYSSINEFIARYNIFRNNIIQLYNSENKSYKTGISKFFDLTKQEFSKSFLNLNYDSISAINNFNSSFVESTDEAPEEWDWRNHGIVGKVFDIGNCNANWAYSVMGNLQSLYALHYGTYEYFSPQMLIDCDTYDHGCDGEWLFEYTFTWLKENGGIMLESDYPYTGKKSTCKSDPSKYINMKVTGYKKLGNQYSTWLSPVDEETMKQFLYKNGPLTVALNANILFSYRSGIIDVSRVNCPAEGVDHMALLVGYGIDESKGKEYWIVQNFWGKSWGEGGFFRIRRGTEMCNINSYVFTGLVSFD